METEENMRDLQTLWDYLNFDMKPQKAGCIVGFGNYNADIPLRASELYAEGFSEYVLFSGGLGRNTEGLLKTSEAELFADIAVSAGVPRENILIEPHSTNTGENIRFTLRLLEEKGIPSERLLIVHQPFMGRRVRAAFDIYSPGTELIITSPQTDLPTFLAHAEKYGITRRAAVEEIVGNYERIESYARRGWQSPQPFSEEAQRAYERLAAAGFTGQLSK